MKRKLILAINCATTPTPALVHEHIAQVLHFPQYYGANKDALRDCFSDVRIEHDIHLVWHDTKASREHTALRELHALLRELCGTQGTAP